MGQASPARDWDGLRISAAPEGDVGPVLLTGHSYSTVVRIQNLTPRPRKGRLAFTWTVADQASTPLIATFEIPPSASTQFVIQDWIPTRVGYAELRVHLYIARVDGTVESNLEEPADRYGNLATSVRGPIYTLYSSSVRDAKEWEVEQAWQAEQRQRTNLLIILAGIAAVAGAATVLLILFHL